MRILMSQAFLISIWDRYLGFDQKQTIDIYWYLKTAKMAVNQLLTLLTRYMICGYDSCYAFG